jgi:hypothetical protein
MATILWTSLMNGRHTAAQSAAVTDADPLIRAALERSTTPLTNEAYLWHPVSFFFLRYLGAEFEDGISLLINRLKLENIDVQTFRYLCHLFFHPLQNIQQHGTTGSKPQFAGVLTRVVSEPFPDTPAIAEYRNALGLNHSDQRYLEAIFHDEGLGIAEHYYNSQEDHISKPFSNLHPFYEWVRLNRAFERHATSKDFHRRTSSTDMPPGVGLASLMRSLKSLRAFLELRTGRYRVYRWFRETEGIPLSSMLLPIDQPEILSPIRATVLRLFIPIP